MAKKIILFSILLLALLAGSSQAKLKLTLEPGATYFMGDTEYELYVGYSYDSAGTTIKEELRSLLEFPQDGILLGSSFYLYDPMQKDIWYLAASVHTNISSPSEKMLDSDWYGKQPYIPYTKFSYTESDVENRIINTDVHIARHIAQLNKTNIFLVLGFKYNYFKQNVSGYNGWQKVLDTVTNEYSDPITVGGNAPAIDYTLKIKQPYIGFNALFNIGKIENNMMAAFAPVFYSNEDDHLLRYKLSTSDGDGEGYLFNYSFKFDINPERNVYLKINTEYNYYQATGKQEQIWYDDEISGSEVIVPSGTKISGIPHQIEGSSFSIGAYLGMSFK